MISARDTDSAYKRLENIIGLLSKLVSSASKNDDSFLCELFDMAFEQIPEADYGSVSIVEHGIWRFIDAKGHNIEILKDLNLKADYKAIGTTNDDLRSSSASGDNDYNVFCTDNILEQSKSFMPKAIYTKLVEASRPSKQSLIVELNFRGESVGRVSLDIASGSDKSFSDDSKRLLGAFGSLASAFMTMKQSNTLVNKLEALIKLSGKMSIYAMNKDEEFLGELLDIAMELIPEADYGSISAIEGDSWRFVAARGHDLQLLQSIPFKKQYFYDYRKDDIEPFVLFKQDNVVLTDYIVDNVQPRMPEEIYKQFTKASKEIRQSLIVQLNVNEDWVGHLGLDIDIESYKKFSTQSVKVLNAFGSLASAFMAFQKLSVLQKRHEDEMNLKLQKSQQWNKALEDTVADRTFAIRNLLNNTGQGVLTFGENLLINDEYSAQCGVIFGQIIKRRKLSDLIYSNDEEQKKLIDGIFKEIFNNKTNWSEVVYLSLLPEELLINNRNIKFEYKLIDDSSKSSSKLMMVIMTDITDKRVLEDQVEKERKMLKMVVKIVANFSSFTECIKNYRDFCDKELEGLLNSGMSSKTVIFEIFKNIHNFKGSLSLFDMVNIVNKLHEMESGLAEYLKNTDEINYHEFKAFIKSNNLLQWLESDLAIIGDILGRKFLQSDSTVTVDKASLKNVEKKIINQLSAYDCRMILPDLRRLSYRPFRELIKTYPEYVQKMGERIGKLIGQCEITGGEFLIDIEKYHFLARSLIHIFRNSLDHGIESMEERVNAGKFEYGTIKCDISVIKDEIVICIADDGRGISTDCIAKKALEKGLCSKESLEGMSKEEILDLVFIEGFSTKADVSVLSGRGVGLAAVKKEVEKLNGSISIYTHEGVGTTFCVKLPNEESVSVMSIAVSDIMNPIIETAKQFIMEQVGIKDCRFNNIFIEQVQKLYLKRVSSFINVKGIIRGKFIMSMDEMLLRRIIKQFVLEDLTEEEEVSYMEDTLAECSNIILGNSIKSFPNIEEYVIMESPVTMLSDNAALKYSESGIWTCTVECETGSMDISFVTDELVS
ncbi:MAG: ATP-binding protein [Bacillota bacterium]